MIKKHNEYWIIKTRNEYWVVLPTPWNPWALYMFMSCFTFELTIFLLHKPIAVLILFWVAFMLFAYSMHLLIRGIKNEEIQAPHSFIGRTLHSGILTYGYQTTYLGYLALVLFGSLILSPNSAPNSGDDIESARLLLDSLNTWHSILIAEYHTYLDPMVYQAFFHTEDLIQVTEVRWNAINDYVGFLERNNMDDCEYYDELNQLAEDIRGALNDLTSFYREMQRDTGFAGLDIGDFED